MSGFQAVFSFIFFSLLRGRRWLDGWLEHLGDPPDAPDGLPELTLRALRAAAQPVPKMAPGITWEEIAPQATEEDGCFRGLIDIQSHRFTDIFRAAMAVIQGRACEKEAFSLRFSL